MRVWLGALVVAGIVAVAAPVAAQVENGDGGNDRLRGTSKADTLNGRGGDDVLLGRGGDDRLEGGAGDDELDGSGGGDRIDAGRGADLIVGGGGDDVIVGGRGIDGINMVDGVEVESPGRDVIKALDGEADEISCGEGDDRAIVDEVEDGVYDCEEVIEP